MCTQNFGFLSSFFHKERGVNQGCPLSPSLYLLMAEILANKLRQDPKIKGITVNNIQYLISQFADDTDLYLSYDQGTVNRVFEIFAGIERNTGLRISYEKTTMYRIGSIANTNAKLYTPRKINWANNYINTLGIDIGNNSVSEKNLDAVIAKMRAVANMWYFRSMTIIGKVAVINALMSSLFIYRLQILPPIKEKYVKEFENTVLDFLWHGKKAKIPLKVLQTSKLDGGLGLTDICRKHKSLLFNWIHDCKKNEKIRNLATAALGIHAQTSDIWLFNLNKQESSKIFAGNSFWHQIVHEWHEYSKFYPQNADSVKEEVIWYNRNIKIKGAPVYMSKLHRAGILTRMLLSIGSRYSVLFH